METPFFLNEESSVVEEREDHLTSKGDQGRVGPATEPSTGAAMENSGKVIKEHEEVAKGGKPFPYRFAQKRKKEDPVDYLSIFGRLDVTIPFLQAVKLPQLSKFIMEFIAGKAKQDRKIVVEGIASAILQDKLPPKRADPGMFTLPITIENSKIEHAMCDLGVSINVMSLSIYNRLKGVKLANTRVLIQLAARTCINLEGVLENVLVKVHNFLYPADFYVIRMSEPKARESSGILLGRPFLRTAKTIVDMAEGDNMHRFSRRKIYF